MPIFHDPNDSPPWRTASRQMSSDEAQREERMNFNHNASPSSDFHVDRSITADLVPEHVSEQPRMTAHDRNDLIEKIKRVKSPLWHFRQGVSGRDPTSVLLEIL